MILTYQRLTTLKSGYFARVTSLAEVREQVLKYIPVLSRPMVMYKKEHPVIWTPAYIDVAVSSQYFYFDRTI